MYVTPPCRGCSELFRLPAEYKNATDGVPFEYKFPFRNNKWQRGPAGPQQAASASPGARAVSLGGSIGKAPAPDRSAAIPRSVSSDGRPLDPKRWDAPRPSPLLSPTHTPSFTNPSFRDLSSSPSSSSLFLLRFSPGSDNYALASSVVMGRSAHNRNSPSILSYSDVGPAGSAHWRQKSMPEG